MGWLDDPPYMHLPGARVAARASLAGAAFLTLLEGSSIFAEQEQPQPQPAVEPPPPAVEHVPAAAPPRPPPPVDRLGRPLGTVGVEPEVYVPSPADSWGSRRGAHCGQGDPGL